MKFPGILLLLLAAFLFQCEKRESSAGANTAENMVRTGNSLKPEIPNPPDSPENNAKTMDELFRDSGRKGDLEYKISGRLQKKGKSEGINYPNDNLIIEYTVKNTGTKDFILYNQGHSDRETRDLVYAEPLPDGSVELSQKAFLEPKDKTCPLRDAPIWPRGAWLRKGQIVTGRVFVELPLKQQTPFADCTPRAEMPANPKRFKFCLGFQEAEGQNLKIDDQGIISPLPETAKQELLCSESFEIK